MTDQEQQLTIFGEAQGFSLMLPDGPPPFVQWQAATQALRLAPYIQITWWLRFFGQPVVLTKADCRDQPAYSNITRIVSGIALPVPTVAINRAYPIDSSGTVGFGGLDVILHELGHYFSSKFNGQWGLLGKPLGYQDDWIALWKSGNWWNPYQAGESEEAIADSFAWVWMTRAGLYPKRLAKPCPQPVTDYWIHKVNQFGWGIT